MFRTAQFRRQTRAFIDAQPGLGEAARRANAVANVAAFVALQAVAANLPVLGMRQSDVEAFLRTAIDNEHRGGFIVRALFFSEHELELRQALTDASGLKVGAYLITDEFDQVLGTPAPVALTRIERARIVARVHNSGVGPGAIWLANWVQHPATVVNTYVNNVMAHWNDPGP